MLITVFGRRGSGKTTLIRAKLQSFKKPVVIIDILGNYEDEGVVCTDVTQALLALRAYVTDPKKNPGSIVCLDSDLDRCVDYMCSALWKLGGGTLVIDEADAISIPAAPCFDEAIRYGRNRGIDVITGCRRPAEISKNITAGSDLALCLVTHEPRDIDYYRDFLGEELAEKLPSLPPHHGVYKDFKNQRSGVFRCDPSGRIHYLNSDAPPKGPDRKERRLKSRVPSDAETLDTAASSKLGTLPTDRMEQSESDLESS